MLCCPFRSPFKGPRRFPGGMSKSVSWAALLNIRSFRLARTCSSLGYRRTWKPCHMLLVSFVPRERIMSQYYHEAILLSIGYGEGDLLSAAARCEICSAARVLSGVCRREGECRRSDLNRRDACAPPYCQSGMSAVIHAGFSERITAGVGQCQRGQKSGGRSSRCRPAQWPRVMRCRAALQAPRRCRGTT